MTRTDGAGRTGTCGAAGVGRRTGGWGLVPVPEVLASEVPLAVWLSEVAPADTREAQSAWQRQRSAALNHPRV
jgi:hypothetical protein